VVQHERSRMTLTTLAFHAEKLQEPRVWRQVRRIARWTAIHNIKMTFFVYPFPALVTGESIIDRVQWLGSLGHEIAQHTHFYAGKKIEKKEKVDDLSEANILHCVRRDFETLKAMGFPPTGFTAGSWFVNETVLDVLVELGFIYDCSAQFPKPHMSAPAPHTQWLRSPQYYSNNHGQILRLPTTCSIGEWFKWGRKTASWTFQFHQIVYLHDYDLLSFHRYLLLSCFLKMRKARTFSLCSTMAEYYRS
jgi:hypothetical protein